MKINWKVEEDDIGTISELVSSQFQTKFVQNRVEKNINLDNIPIFNKETFWKSMLACILSTQQNSGPNSPLSNFCSTNPFLLSLEKCSHEENYMAEYIEEVITNFGGIRRAKSISLQAESNYNWISDNGWDDIINIFNNLCKQRKELPTNEHIKTEIAAAEFIRENFKGFGPKQSRNLWQTLGLFRFEIPIDSRISKWLNNNIFPFKISSNSLSDINYYQFVMEGIQLLCYKSSLVPCILDASIFASYDPEWNENLIW